jgi:hypothetical protein
MLQGKQISMKFSELTGKRLKWVQPHPFRLKYELRAGDMIVATLSYPHFSDTLAIASSDNGTWTFKGGDLRHRTVSIQVSGVETDLAVFNTYLLGGGVLELPGGRKYEGVLINRGTGYKFKTEEGEALVTYWNVLTYLRTSGEMYIYPYAKDLAEISWLALLGWHLILVTM